MTGFRDLAYRCGAIAFGLALAAPLHAQDDDEPVEHPPNTVCSPDISAGRFSLSRIGPEIAGTWQGTAAGTGYTGGVQTFTMQISFERGRLYISGAGGKVELQPVYGRRKPLRYDFLRDEPLPKQAYFDTLTLGEFELMHECEFAIAPQFTWRLGVGERASGGLYSFQDANFALGSMWNRARGTREVELHRVP